MKWNRSSESDESGATSQTPPSRGGFFLAVDQLAELTVQLGDLVVKLTERGAAWTDQEHRIWQRARVARQCASATLSGATAIAFQRRLLGVVQAQWSTFKTLRRAGTRFSMSLAAHEPDMWAAANENALVVAAMVGELRSALRCFGGSRGPDAQIHCAEMRRMSRVPLDGREALASILAGRSVADLGQVMALDSGLVILGRTASTCVNTADLIEAAIAEA